MEIRPTAVHGKSGVGNVFGDVEAALRCAAGSLVGLLVRPHSFGSLVGLLVRPHSVGSVVGLLVRPDSVGSVVGLLVRPHSSDTVQSYPIWHDACAPALRASVVQIGHLADALLLATVAHEAVISEGGVREHSSTAISSEIRLLRTGIRGANRWPLGNRQDRSVTSPAQQQSCRGGLLSPRSGLRPAAELA